MTTAGETGRDSVLLPVETIILPEEDRADLVRFVCVHGSLRAPQKIPPILIEQCTALKDMVSGAPLDLAHLPSLPHLQSALPTPNDSFPEIAASAESLRNIAKFLRWAAGRPTMPVLTPGDRASRSPAFLRYKDAEAFIKSLNLSNPQLFEMITTANYLDCKPALDAAAFTVSQMIVGFTPEEIRLAFNIKNDFTPEEEEAIRRENEFFI